MAKETVSTKGLRRPCMECGQRTAAWHPILEIQVCRNCQSAHPHKYQLVTKTRALREYRLRENDLYTLKYIAKKNPHYSSSAPMQLFLLPEVEQLAKTKWGCAEPYIVTLSPFSDDVLAWLLEDLERLKELPPDKFQFLIADRLEKFGLDVKIVGDVYRKDGGVDIVAYPKAVSVPFLLAVQVKHTARNAKHRLVMFVTFMVCSLLPTHLSIWACWLLTQLLLPTRNGLPKTILRCCGFVAWTT